jgi:flavin-dependent thymidylate synthase
MKNKVELIGHYGSDITHAQSAWTSTSRDLTQDKMGRIPQLLKMLADEGHETPFEKSALHFLVTCDQATHIHLLKSRIGVSINGESARYKELKEDKTYIPEDWKDIRFNNSSSDWVSILQHHSDEGNKLYHRAIKDLTPILGKKRAKESARFFKTFNSQITMDVMFNWRSFVHFYRLRSTEHAQKEVRELSILMLDKIKKIEGSPFKHTIEAFQL